MKDLPKVFANPIKNNIDNLQDSYRSNNNTKPNKKISIKDIDDILNSKNHIFRSKVKLLINNEYKEHKIINRIDNYIITIDNEKIPIDIIDDIKLI